MPALTMWLSKIGQFWTSDRSHPSCKGPSRNSHAGPVTAVEVDLPSRREVLDVPLHDVGATPPRRNTRGLTRSVISRSHPCCRVAALEHHDCACTYPAQVRSVACAAPSHNPRTSSVRCCFSVFLGRSPVSLGCAGRAAEAPGQALAFAGCSTWTRVSAGVVLAVVGTQDGVSFR